MLKLLETYLERYRTYLYELRDVRVVGLVLFGVVVLLVSWSGIKAIDSNYRLEKQISTLKQQNDVQNLSNTNLQLQNEYYKTNQYLELSARQNFGLAKPGETELIVPKNVALAHTVSTTDSAKQNRSSSAVPAWERHFRAWANFFLHRQSAN